MALHQDLNTTPLPSLILVGKNNLRMNTTSQLQYNSFTRRAGHLINYSTVDTKIEKIKISS
jgi:hypothetical protein